MKTRDISRHGVGENVSPKLVLDSDSLTAIRALYLLVLAFSQYFFVKTNLADIV